VVSASIGANTAPVAGGTPLPPPAHRSIVRTAAVVPETLHADKRGAAAPRLQALAAHARERATRKSGSFRSGKPRPTITHAHTPWA
jgi:hypothetical protein